MNQPVRGNAAHSNERLDPLRLFMARIARDADRALRACGGLSLVGGKATYMLLRPDLSRRGSSRMFQSFDV